MSGKRLKIKITKNKNIDSVVDVANIGEIDYLNPKLTLSVGEIKEVPSRTAKHFFGDWDKSDTYIEQKRREDLNIHLIDVEFVEIEKKIKKQEYGEKQVFEKKVIESEFEDLDEIVEEVKEPKKCAGKTKAGKPCKAYTLEGSDYCGVHKPKK